MCAYWGLLNAVLDKEWHFAPSPQTSSARQVRFRARNGWSSASVGIAQLHCGTALRVQRRSQTAAWRECGVLLHEARR